MNNISTEFISDNSSISPSQINAALQISGMAIWEFNPTNEIMKLNDNWFYMLGYSKNELEESLDTFFKLLHPDNTVVCQVRRSRLAIADAEEEEEEGGEETAEGTVAGADAPAAEATQE